MLWSITLSRKHISTARPTAFFRASPRQPAQLGREVEEAAHGHVGVARGVLRQVAEQALRGHRVLHHVVAADRDPAGRRRNEARHHAHGGGLARAVGSQEAQHLAALDRERNVVHRELGPERLGQVFDLDHASLRRRPAIAAGTALFLFGVNIAGAENFQRRPAVRVELDDLPLTRPAASTADATAGRAGAGSLSRTDDLPLTRRLLYR